MKSNRWAGSSSRASFNLEDFSKQLQPDQEDGPLTQAARHDPPAWDAMTQDLAPDVTDKQMGRIEAIINSMTHEERLDPRTLNGSRQTGGSREARARRFKR